VARGGRVANRISAIAQNLVTGVSPCILPIGKVLGKGLPQKSRVAESHLVKASTVTRAWSAQCVGPFPTPNSELTQAIHLRFSLTTQATPKPPQTSCAVRKPWSAISPRRLIGRWAGYPFAEYGRRQKGAQEVTLTEQREARNDPARGNS